MMIIYLCNGKNEECKNSPRCGVNNPDGDCIHTANHLYSRNNPDVSPGELLNPGVWEKCAYGDFVQYWEKEVKNE